MIFPISLPLRSVSLSLSHGSTGSSLPISLSDLISLNSQSHSLPLAVSVFGKKEQRRENEEGRREKKKIK
jgi:hypothetical protein